MPATAVTVPPVQVVLALGGVAMTTPAGKLSVKSRLLAMKVLALLSMVNVRVLTSPEKIVLGANSLAKVGGGSMTRLAVAGPALGKPDADRSEVVLRKLPATAVTGTCNVTENVQDVTAVRLPPVNRRFDVPLSCEPGPQILASGNPVATRPGITAFKSSLNPRSVTAEAFRLLMVKDNTGLPVAVVGPSKDLLKAK